MMETSYRQKRALSRDASQTMELEKLPGVDQIAASPLTKLSWTVNVDI
jgi:hypothetical protein